jgi:hypothetical protein
VLRGLHLQNPKTQGKLVSVLRGRVRDVAVDVRRGSPTFGQHVAVELNDESRRQLWVPRGFAHGFVVLSETADFFYKCDDFYSPADEIVVRWNDPAIGIAWGIEAPGVSARDAAARARLYISVGRTSWMIRMRHDSASLLCRIPMSKGSRINSTLAPERYSATELLVRCSPKISPLRDAIIRQTREYTTKTIDFVCGRKVSNEKLEDFWALPTTAQSGFVFQHDKSPTSMSAVEVP